MTDGGIPQDDSAADPSLDALRASVSPHVFAVDPDDRLTTVSESLDALAEETSLSRQHVSSLLAVPSEDLGSHLRTVRRRLEDPETSTVRSTVCRLRAATGRREVTVEFSRHPDSGSPVSPAERLVGVVREGVVELGATQPEPGVGPERFRRLFEQLPDPVAEVQFVGDDPIVASVNPAFEEMFGYAEATLIGEQLNEYIVPEGTDKDASKLDQEAASGEWTSGEVVREAADGPRLFLFRGIPFTHDGQQCGFGVYTDVTDRESQQRYHEVLNRLLRHNLRNDLNVILGLADQLASLDSTGTETTAVSERLKQRALDLVETTRRARELQSVIDRSETDTAPVPVGQLVAEACERIEAGYPNVTVDCAAERPAVGMAGPALQEAVIELVENAVEHAAAEPTLHLRVETRPDHETVVITVADDGSGIPEDERAVVEGRQSITPLDHGSGLGLWLAKWIVEAYGGELAFVGPDPELGGAAVELRVRQPPSETTAANGAALDSVLDSEADADGVTSTDGDAEADSE